MFLIFCTTLKKPNWKLIITTCSGFVSSRAIHTQGEVLGFTLKDQMLSVNIKCLKNFTCNFYMFSPSFSVKISTANSAYAGNKVSTIHRHFRGIK